MLSTPDDDDDDDGDGDDDDDDDDDDELLAFHLWIFGSFSTSTTL